MTLWMNVVLLLASAVMVSIVLYQAVAYAPRISQGRPRRLWRLLLLLMIIFLIGDGAVLALVWLDRHQALASLTSVLFVAGALFVLLTFFLTVKLTRHLEARVRQRTAQLEAARQAAESANLAKSQFLANMSHELRTPLNAVVGFANILRKNKHRNLADRELLYLDRIADNGKRLLALINDILDLSKIETGHMDLYVEHLDLERLLREVVGQFTVELRNTPVKLLTEVPPQMKRLMTDRRKLTQILLNLISNALKFTSEGHVKVRVVIGARSRQPVRIDVADTGIGIPGENLERIFEEFQQADGSTSRKYGGTGLGLSISRSLCRLMGYELTAASAGSGRGSTFTVHFVEDPEEPVLEPHGRKHSQEIRPMTDEELEHSLASALADKTVLVIADAVGLAATIRDLGASVLEADGGEEGLRLALEVQPDLVALATQTPAVAGRQLIAELRRDSHLQSVPILWIGQAEAGDDDLPGPVERLALPVESEALLQVLWRNLFRA